MAIRMRRGLESELDISKAVPGEWLVSTDTRIVRMCVAPGIVLRMATYEAFEADTQKFIEQMEQILSETKTVQEAVERIQNEIEDSVITVENYVESAKGYSNLSNTYAMQSKMYAEESNNYADDSYNEAERAKMYAENAEAVTNVKIASQTEAGLMRGGENYVDESGTLVLTKQTTDATLYNSYSGGLKIDRIAGASKQNQYTGKNLFDLSTFTTINTGVTIDEVDLETGYAKVTFENAAERGAAYSTKFSLVDSDTYIFSANAIAQDSSINIVIQAFDAGTGLWVINYKVGVSFTASSEYMYRFAIQNNTGAKYSGTVEVDSIQLELGSVATDYEPYVGGIPSPNPDYPQEIKSVEVSEIKTHGKNLIPYPYCREDGYSQNGITYNVDTDGIITANGTVVNDTTFFSFVSKDPLFPHYDGKVTLSIKSDSALWSVFFAFYDTEGTNIKEYAVRNQNGSVTFEYPDEDTYYKITIAVYLATGKTVKNDSIKVQLELGDAATDYEPYQESVATLSEAVTLHGIDDVKDRIVRKDGVLCIERNYYDFTLDGSETWTLGSVDNLFRTTVVAGISPKAITAMLSDSYICSMQSVANMPDKTIRQSVTADSTTAVAHIKDSSYTTVDELTAALAENPVRCIVMRAEPTYESLPTADQIALMSLKTFDTVTYISTDSDIEPIIEVEHGTSRVGAYTLECCNDREILELENDDLKSSVSDLMSYVGYTDETIYGVEVDFTNKKFTRLDGAAELSAGSDFDSIAMFGGRKRCNVADDGTVNAYYGDTAYAEDGSNGQVMVEQPKFYYKVVPLELEKIQSGKGYHMRKVRYYVSETPRKGFKLHPAFIRNGVENDFIYLSAYEGCTYDTSASAYKLDDAQDVDWTNDVLASIAGAKPTSGLSQSGATRNGFRTIAAKRGEGWTQQTVQAATATELLFLIEYASFNMQSAIGVGVTNKTYDDTTSKTEITGATTTLGNSSGSVTNTNGYNVVSYRGEENFFGNIWKWIDGINIYNYGIGSVHIADHDFADNTQAEPYEDAGITIVGANGYVSAFAYNEEFDWLFMASEVAGNSSLPVGDYFYQNRAESAYTVARLGGSWYDGAGAGGFFWSVNSASSIRHSIIGGRLLYVPDGTA